jgi:membrane-bound inhibitor of C-type lysozyme
MSKIYGTLILLGLFAYGWWYFTPHYSPEVVAPTLINEISYSCNNNKTIQAKIYEGKEITVQPGEKPIPTGSVELILSDGRTLTLMQTISASGVRYALEDESFVFWSKGNTALILENDTEKDFTGCIVVANQPLNSELSQVYTNHEKGFSIRLYEGTEIDESYTQELSSGQKIEGVRFFVPKSISEGTNLSDDTSIMIEEISDVETCTADLFLENTTDGERNMNIGPNDTVYSVASSNDAAAGNRYEEVVFAIPGSSPCTAMRYFTHYGVFENYPADTIKEFDKEALIKKFDAIRMTWVQS